MIGPVPAVRLTAITAYRWLMFHAWSMATSPDGLCRSDTPRVEADNPAWVLPEPGAGRALSVALKLMDQAACAWKHDKDLSNRLTGQAAVPLGHDGVLTIIGLHRTPGSYLTAARLRGRGLPAWPRRGTPGSPP
jgi:hypothetical protein